MPWRCWRSACSAAMAVSRALNLAGWAFASGILLFSGSLYLLALTDIRWLGAVTPFGGTAFLIGWGALAWHAAPAYPVMRRPAQADANRVLKNQRHLGKWARREGIEAYRLYDRDIPEFPAGDRPLRRLAACPGVRKKAAPGRCRSRGHP